MSNSSPPPLPKAYYNQHAWITPETFLTYAAFKRIDLRCKECQSPGPHWIDTGSNDGMVPRSTSYSTTPAGQVNMADSLHMPVVRVICNNCGNIRQFSIHYVELWRTMQQPSGDLFGNGGNGNT